MLTDACLSLLDAERLTAMPRNGSTAALSKLEEKRAALDEEIKALKRQQRQEKLALEKRRYLILGRALAKELAENHTLAATLEPILDARVTNPKERAILELSPLSQEPPAAGQ